jgi:UDP-N-acetylmuramate--alanine ligase
VADMPAAVFDAARDQDVVVLMGAGSIGAIPAQLVGTNKQAAAHGNG